VYSTIIRSRLSESYPRDDLPKIDRYPDGQTLPNTKNRSILSQAPFLAGVSGELGLRKYLESQGHTLVVTSDKDGADSVLDRELPDAEIVISQPFWPAYMTAERFAKAPKLKTRGDRGNRLRSHRSSGGHGQGVTVAEVTFCNSISVSSMWSDDPVARSQLHSVLQWVVQGGWNIADCVEAFL